MKRLYGGTGSGALSDAYPTVSLLEGIENAGIKVDQDLVQFYTDNASERPVVGIGEQDWTLPEPTVDSWCPGTGQSGFLALGNVLTGDVNPSGRTSDTFVADLTATPTYNNFGGFVYDNVDEFEVEAYGCPSTPTFVNYVEGIYVGIQQEKML